MGPCTWPVSYAECNTPVDETEEDPALREQAEEMATAFLWNWTGRIYGSCPVTLRPCRSDCHASTWEGTRALWTPALIDGKWFNLTCGQCPSSAGCSCDDGAASLTLPGPITEVTEVLIDGEVLSPGSYRVDNHSLLVRTDGGAWPTCQDLSAQPTEPGTWQVTYLRGHEVPVGGQVSAGVLAEEFVKALCNDNSCRLPRRVQSITRQGVSMAVLDSFEDLDKGRTGIWLIDSWIASVIGVRPGGRVYSPDLPNPRYRKTTWPA